jgi:microcystin-dependent protein
MPLLLGGIVMWSGSINEIPNGWALCNGANNTVDLRNRFVVGAGDLYAVNATGGSANAKLPSHTHSVSTDSVASHTHNLLTSNNNGSSEMFNTAFGGEFGGTNTDSHSHTVSVNTVGTSATNANLPPYYALAFIQQIA